MNTQLDERRELINKIEILSIYDIQKLKVFIAGMEAEKAIDKCEKKERLQTVG